MIFHIPIHIEGVKEKGGKLVYHARPLFFDEPTVKDEQLHRLYSRLAREVDRKLVSLGREARHDQLSQWSFAPNHKQHRVEIRIELRRRGVELRLFFVSFKHMGKRLCFSPTIPEVWFEVNRGETIRARAAEVYAAHFRELERTLGEENVRPERLGLTGTAWTSELTLPVMPPKAWKKPVETTFLSLGSDTPADGGMELIRVGHCLDWLWPDELERALYRDELADELERLLKAPDRRPVLLLGPRLVGKTTIIHEVVRRRVAPRKSPFRAKANVWLISPQRLISGMSFVGQWEDRLLAILKVARKRDHVLYFDNLPGLFLAGQSASSSLSVAGVLRPWLEEREVRILGEITPEEFRVLQERDRSIADAFHILPVREPIPETTRRILIGDIRRLETKFPVRFEPDVLPVVEDIQRRYERTASFPGKAARMLNRLAVRAEQEQTEAAKNDDEAEDAPRDPRTAVTRDIVLEEFRRLSGLSIDFLDPNRRLLRSTILDALRVQVTGQDTALEAAADVISIAKARLNDTDRPLASFLFPGPTGVGKTETAKAIARTLFGSDERLLRFDMNEYLDAGSAMRLVGTFSREEGLLTAAIRRQPFAVVLFDEIEKAHPEVFDLLLQVLGEGRLTDAMGRTADFTNALIVLTSNLGVREAESRIGFAENEQASAGMYHRAVERFFRPEFFNRLDRIIPFRRLGRDDVRGIARRMVASLLTREGFQQRRCILEVAPAALERIVDTGFDPILGARAIRRALEKHLAAPVAAQLAEIPLDGFSVILIASESETEFRLRATVQSLLPLSQLPEMAEGEKAPPRVQVRQLLQRLRKTEDAIGEYRPRGAVNHRDLTPSQFRYYEMKELAETIRESLEEVDLDPMEERIAKLNRPAFPMKEQARVGEKKLSSEHRYGMISGSTMRDLSKVTDISAAISELSQHRSAALGLVDEMRSRMILLDRMIHRASDTGGDEVLVWIRGLNELSATPADKLAGLIRGGLNSISGIEVTLVASDKLPVSDRVLRFRGSPAGMFAELEAGTHLWFPEHAAFVPLRVVPMRLADGDDIESRIAEVLRAEEAYSRTRTGPEPFPWKPVVRIYADPGRGLDFRTGIAITELTAEKFRTIVLSTLIRQE